MAWSLGRQAQSVGIVISSLRTLPMFKGHDDDCIEECDGWEEGMVHEVYRVDRQCGHRSRSVKQDGAYEMRCACYRRKYLEPYKTPRGQAGAPSRSFRREKPLCTLPFCDVNFNFFFFSTIELQSADEAIAKQHGTRDNISHPIGENRKVAPVENPAHPKVFHALSALGPT